jgi:Flp pilus assembly protein TadD
MAHHGTKTKLAVALACCVLAGCASRPDPRPSLNAESRLRVAAAAEAAGDRDLAASMYAEAATAPNANTATLIQCAEGLARSGKPDQAASLLTRHMTSGPDQTDLLRTLGGIQVLQGNAAVAAETFSRVLAARPDDVKALVNKGVALDMMRRHQDAQALYRQALALAPNDAATVNDLAVSQLLSGRADEGRETLLPFGDVAGLPERIRVNLGIMDAASGHAEDAQQMLGSRIAAEDLAALTQAINNSMPPISGEP